MSRRASALAPLMALALAAPVAPARAADAAIDLGAAFTRTCFAPGATLELRRDALLQRGADLVPNEDPADPAQLFMIFDEGMATVFLLGPDACTVASRDTSIPDARRQFQAAVRAVAGDDVAKRASFEDLEPLDDGEYLEVYERRTEGRLVRYTLMITNNPNGSTTVFMVVDDDVPQSMTKEKRW